MDKMGSPATLRVLRKKERSEVLTRKEHLQRHMNPIRCDIWAVNKLMIGLATKVLDDLCACLIAEF